MDWNAITALSTLVATVVISIAAIFEVMQLNEMKRSRKLELLMRLFDDYSSPKTRENRRFIYRCLPRDPSQLSDEHFLIIDDVLAGLDRAWLFIKYEQLEPEVIFEIYGEIFLRLWGVLYPIVLYERKRRGEYYRERAEALIELTKKYFLQKKRPIDYPVYGDSTKDEQVTAGIQQDTRR
jgi:hypothetical protein